MMQQSDNHFHDTKEQKNQKTMVKTGRNIRRVAIVVVVILAVNFLVVHRARSKREHEVERITKETASAPPAVDVTTVGKAPSSMPLVLPGTTAAWYESSIYARVDGYVGSWNADIGDHVRKGQVLAILETPDLDAQLVAARAKLKASDTLVEFTKSTYERWKDSPKGVVSDQEREAKKADYDRAVAQAGLNQADVDRYTVLTAFKRVTAPYDGTITKRHIDIGDLVTSGSTSSTAPLYRIVQDNPMRVFVDVPQNVEQDIRTGLAAHVNVNNIPGRTFDGKVARTTRAINEQTRTLRVEVDIPNPDHALVSGMYVDVDFAVPCDNLLQIPAAALVFKSDGPEVAVVDKLGKVDFRKITIAHDNGSTIQISSGISEGDHVALNIDNQITQGKTVSVQNKA